MDEYQLRDDWRRNQIIRHNSYPPPDVPIWDYSEGEDCVCLKINRKWIPFISGVLDILNDEIYWSTNDPEFPLTSISELITAVHGASDLMNCDPAITDITFDDDGRIKFVRNGETIEVSGSERIVTGVNAIAGGFEVEQGGVFTDENPDCADPCNQYPDTPVYDQSGSLRACAIADGLVEYTMEKYQDFLDQADVAANAVDVVQSALKLVFPPSYILFAPAVELVKAFFDIGIASARTFDTVEFRDDFKESLYCFIRENGDILTADLWIEFRDGWFSSNAPALIEQYFETYEPKAIEDQAHKQSYNEDGECASFDCSCVVKVDFSSTLNYSILSGTRTNGVGNPDWASLATGSGSNGSSFTIENIVKVDLGSSIPLGEITYDYKATGSIDPTANRNMQQRIRGSVDGTTWTTLVNLTSGDNQPQGVWYNRSRTWTPDLYRYIEIRLFAGWGDWGTGTMNSQIILDNLCVK